MKSLLACLTCLLALLGCAAGPDVPVNMFVGERTNEQVATLLPVPLNTASVLLRVDGQPVGNCFTSCSFSRPVRVLPGTRKLYIEVFYPPLTAQTQIVPPDRLDRAIALAVNRSSVLVNSAMAELPVSFEAGRSYRLMLGIRSNDSPERYVWWEPVR